MPVLRNVKSIAGVALTALAVGGCGSLNSMSDTFKSDAGWFSKPVGTLFSREDGSGTMGTRNVSLGPSGPVGPEELVNPDGSCAPEVAPAAQPSADGTQPMAESHVTLGGIGLGMTECQAVRRAGMPSNIAVGADGTERKVVLTYVSGQWPGIYTFVSGRLKEVDAPPAPPKPARPAPRKPAPRRS